MRKRLSEALEKVKEFDKVNNKCVDMETEMDQLKHENMASKIKYASEKNQESMALAQLRSAMDRSKLSEAAKLASVSPNGVVA